MKNIILNILSWILVVSLLSLYLHKKLSFPLVNYLFILGLSLIILGILSFTKSIVKNRRLKNINEVKASISLKNIEANTISVFLVGLISLLTSILV